MSIQKFCQRGEGGGKIFLTSWAGKKFLKVLKLVLAKLARHCNILRNYFDNLEVSRNGSTCNRLSGGSLSGAGKNLVNPRCEIKMTRHRFSSAEKSFFYTIWPALIRNGRRSGGWGAYKDLFRLTGL